MLLAAIAVIAMGACGDDDLRDIVAPTVASVATPLPVATPLIEATSPPATPTAVAPGATQAAPTPVLTPSPEPTQPPTAEPAPARPVGGVFRRLWDDPPTLDPHLTSDTTSAYLVVELFSGLVALSTDLELVPDIAESWEISEDGQVYTFYLRPDVTFQDGKPVTAHDFRWSMERAASPETGSPTASTYLGDIVGATDVLEGKATEFSGIRVIDDYTLQITIDAPKAYFLAKLTYPTAYVLDQETVESGGSRWTDSPNGTGPFKLAEYRIGERIVLERNDRYYREPAYLDSVVMSLAGGQAMAMYENDEIDITGVGIFDLDRALDSRSPLNRDLVVVPPAFSVSYIGFNTTVPPFDNANFRRALNHAVDKEFIAEQLYRGLVVPAYGVLPPGFPGYDPALKGLRFDPALAQQFLSESSYGSLPAADRRIVMTVPGTGGPVGPDLEVVIEMWRQILGLDVAIQQSEWATYLFDLNRNRLQLFAGSGWEADYPDPQDFLDILFHSESSINHGAYSNPEVDAILERARVEPDVQKRIAQYREAERLIVADAPWVPLYYTGERYALIKPHVKGYKLTPMIVPKLREVYIEE